MSATGISLIFIIIIAVSAVFAMAQGFWRSLVATAGWLIAIVLGIVLQDAFGNMISSYFSSPATAKLVAFLVITFAVALVGLVLKLLLGWLGSMGEFSIWTRILAAIVGCVRGIIWCIILVAIGGVTSLAANPNWQQDFFVKVLTPWVYSSGASANTSANQTYRN